MALSYWHVVGSVSCKVYQVVFFQYVVSARKLQCGTGTEISYYGECIPGSLWMQWRGSSSMGAV